MDDRGFDVQPVEEARIAAAGDRVPGSTRRERRVEEVAWQPDHRDLAGVDVDLDEEHDVHPPAPAVASRIGAQEEEVEPPVTTPRDRTGAGPRDRHVQAGQIAGARTA